MNKFLISIILFLLFSFLSLHSQEINATIDSLESVLKKQLNQNHSVADTNVVKTRNQIAKSFEELDDYEKVLENSDKARQESIQLKYYVGYANALEKIAYSHYRLGDYNLSIKEYKELIEIYLNGKQNKKVAETYLLLATNYFLKGDYKDAHDNYCNGLKISEQIANIAITSDALQYLGNTYLYTNNYVNALKYYKQGEIAAHKIKDQEKENNCKNGIALCYYELKDYQNALKLFLEILKSNIELKNQNGIANAYNNIGIVYDRGFKNYPIALKYYFNSMKIRLKLNDKNQIAGSYSNIGGLYEQMGNNESARAYFKRFEELSKEIGSKYLTMEAYNNWSDFYRKTGDYQKAYEYHKLYSTMKDSILNEESSKQIAELNAQYESEKKEKDIELLTKDKALQQAEIGRQKIIKNGFIVGLVVALGLVMLIYNRFQLTRKQKNIIEHQNSQIVESINYSKKIQDALLPSVAEMQKSIPDLFVFYQPKSIVSGDFYYFKEFEKYIVLACVDCTGHGVPGGFMSTLGSLLLDKVVKNATIEPSEILVQLSNEIIRVLHQQSGGEIQDGMDLSICVIDKQSKIIEFSGARNGLVVVRGGVSTRYKASPMPVGGNYMKKGLPIERKFKTEKIVLQPNDWLFLYTDGFIEQIGGTENMPMNYEQFEAVLKAASAQSSIANRIEALNSCLNSWKKENEQTDDILIIGLPVT